MVPTVPLVLLWAIESILEKTQIKTRNLIFQAQ